jgi:hypothetical protein
MFPVAQSRRLRTNDQIDFAVEYLEQSQYLVDRLAVVGLIEKRFNVRHQPRRRVITGRRRPHAVLAGFLESKQLFSHGLWEIDECELRLVEQVVLPALVDDPNQIIFGGSGIGHNAIHLAYDERRFVAAILKAQREWLGWMFHGVSK